MFVLYKISLLQYTYMDDHCVDVLFPRCPKLLHLSLEALVKTQSDDVRLNCVGGILPQFLFDLFHIQCAVFAILPVNTYEYLQVELCLGVGSGSPIAFFPMNIIYLLTQLYMINFSFTTVKTMSEA